MEVIGLQLHDVLELAMQMEKKGAQFFEVAAAGAPRTEERRMLDGLAVTEQAHLEALLGLRERLGQVNYGAGRSDAVLSRFVASWLEEGVYETHLGASSGVAARNTLADTLQVAIRMKESAIALYSGFMESLADEVAAGVIERILQEELRHVAELSSAIPPPE